ncbi:18173_t:CDS:2, partial [Gigaspora margarita]
PIHEEYLSNKFLLNYNEKFEIKDLQNKYDYQLPNSSIGPGSTKIIDGWLSAINKSIDDSIFYNDPNKLGCTIDPDHINNDGFEDNEWKAKWYCLVDETFNPQVFFDAPNIEIKPCNFYFVFKDELVKVCQGGKKDRWQEYTKKIMYKSNILEPVAMLYYCSCSWPYHLLLPCETREGINFKLFEFISDWNIDKVPDSTEEGSLIRLFLNKVIKIKTGLKKQKKESSTLVSYQKSAQRSYTEELYDPSYCYQNEIKDEKGKCKILTRCQGFEDISCTGWSKDSKIQISINANNRRAKAKYYNDGTNDMIVFE